MDLDVDLTQELDPALVQAYIDARADVTNAQARVDDLKAQVVAALTSDEGEPAKFGTVAGARVLAYTTIHTSRIDTKRFRREWPDIAEQYSRIGTHTRLDIT